MFLLSFSQHRLIYYIRWGIHNIHSPHFAFSLSISFLSPSSLGSGPSCALPSVRPDMGHKQTSTVVSQTTSSTTNSLISCPPRAWVWGSTTTILSQPQPRLNSFLENPEPHKILGWSYYQSPTPALKQGDQFARAGADGHIAVLYTHECQIWHHVFNEASW